MAGQNKTDLDPALVSYLSCLLSEKRPEAANPHTPCTPHTHLRSVWQRPSACAPISATISWSLKPCNEGRRRKGGRGVKVSVPLLCSSGPPSPAMRGVGGDEGQYMSLGGGGGGGGGGGQSVPLIVYFHPFLPVILSSPCARRRRAHAAPRGRHSADGHPVGRRHRWACRSGRDARE